MSSHQLSQIQRICSHVGIMSKGRLISEGSIAELSKNAGGNKVIIEVQLSEITQDIVDAIKAIKGVLSVEREENSLNITSYVDLRREISKAISDKDGLITKMKLQSYALEDIYMKILKGA